MSLVARRRCFWVFTSFETLLLHLYHLQYFVFQPHWYILKTTVSYRVVYILQYITQLVHREKTLTQACPVATRDGAFALDPAANGRRLQVLDQTNGPLALLDDVLQHDLPPGVRMLRCLCWRVL